MATIVQLRAMTVFNIMDSQAKGDGINDDTAAITNAIAAAGAAGGGIVFFPPGTYKTSGSIVINNDNIILMGAGWGTVIKPVSGAQFDVFSTPIPASVGLSGYVRNYIGIENLMIDCSNMTGTTAGQGNGIHWYGVRYSYIRDVYVLSCKNWAILLDGDNTGPGNNFGYDNHVMRCVFDLSNAGIYATNCEANDFRDIRFKWAGAACLALQPVFGSTDTNALHLRLGSGYNSVMGCILGKGGAYTTEAIRASNSGPCKIIGNRFDQVRNQAIVLNGGNHIVIGNQLGSPGSANTGVPGIQIGSSNNTIIGNKFDNTAGAIHYTYAIAEAGGPFSGNIIDGNNLLIGSSGYISQNAASNNRVDNNYPYNPVTLTPPTVPASGTAQTNLFGVHAMVLVTGGTVSQIAIGGTNTGQTSGWFRVPAGQTITLTYTVAPTWSWFGD